MFECQQVIIAGKHRSAVQAQTDFYLLSNKITDSGYNTVSLLVLQTAHITVQNRLFKHT